MSGGVDPGKAAAAATDIPADWRERAAKGDKARLSALQRYASFDAWADAHFGLTNKISAGELKAPLKPPAADATPEQVAAWRKENNLPEKAADYIAGLKLANGVVPGEADKPMLEAVADMAHKGNYDQKTVNDFVGKYYELQDQLKGAREERDQDFKIASTQTLIEEMGPDFKRNMVGLPSFWAEQPQGIADLVLGARTEDGRLLGETPEVTKWVVGLMRELNPAATLLPPGTDGTPASVEARMREIEGKMYVEGKPNPEYFGTKMEVEYRDLIDAQAKMKSRAA